MKNKIRLSLIILIMIPAMTGVNLNAQDWLQWRGPDREGIVKTTGINLDWSEKKPALLWTFKQAGAAYSAPTIVGTTLYSQGAADGNDFAFALDTKTGNMKWKQILGKEYIQDRGNGPRGSVTIDDNKLYLIRGAGQLHCLSADDGKMLWQKDLVEDFNGKIMSGWGYSESPLIDGDLVICTPGGSEGTMMAFDKNTGETVWRSKDWTDACGYSSPIVVEVDGIRQYIQQASKGVAGVSAKDGKLLWKTDYTITGRAPAAVIPTPIFKDNMVYVTNGYGCGCMGIRLSKAGDGIKADTIYTNRDISNQHGGVVLMNGYIYGHSDRPSDSWTCQNMKTGEIVWTNKIREVGKGAALGVNDRLILLDERTGLMTVIAASPEGWKEFGRMEIPERSSIESMDNMIWTHLVIADNKLYLRDHDLLFCFDIKK